MVGDYINTVHDGFLFQFWMLLRFAFELHNNNNNNNNNNKFTSN